MELNVKRNGMSLTVTLIGELSALTAKELDDLLQKELTGIKSLTLDFSGCDYVSSAGIRVLLNTFKIMKAEKGSMLLSNVGEGFMEVLENTGLDGVFDIS